MTTLREAAQDVVDALIKNPTRVSKEVHIASVVLREVLAQPEQEPVETQYKYIDAHGKDYWTSEPWEGKKVEAIRHLYITPPQRECASTVHDRREWQGLTDEEIIDTANMAPFETMVSAEDYIYVIARAIEAKLKEKNC